MVQFEGRCWRWEGCQVRHRELWAGWAVGLLVEPSWAPPELPMRGYDHDRRGMRLKKLHSPIQLPHDELISFKTRPLNSQSSCPEEEELVTCLTTHTPWTGKYCMWLQLISTRVQLTFLIGESACKQLACMV